MNPYKAIIDWAHGELPQWEADLVMRLLTSPELTAEQANQVVHNALIAFELGNTKDSPEFLPQTFTEQKADLAPPTSIVQLCSIEMIANVNAIHCDANLPFGHEGITVIYGENGTGKSGYSRILKNACFAKHVESNILGNVYKEKNPLRSAKINFKVNGDRHSWTWAPGLIHENLSLINVFDTHCGKAILDASNKVTYKPKGTEIFDYAPRVFDSIKSAIESLKVEVKKPKIDGLEEHAEVQTWLDKISDETPIENLKATISWTDQDELIKSTLEKSIAEFDNGTTKKTIDKLERILTERLPRIFSKLESCQTILHEQKESELLALKLSIARAQEAHDAANLLQNKSYPLDGVYTELWKELFLAAKQFSTYHAYAEKDSPNIDEGALCVLCMQPLDEHAKDRMQAFDQFMLDKTKILLDTVTKKYKETTQSIAQLSIPDIEMYEPFCADLLEILGYDGGISEAFSTYRRRKELLQQSSKDGQDYNTTTISPTRINEKLKEALSQKLAEKNENFKPEKNTEDKTELKKKQAKKLVSNELEKIITYINSLIQNKKVETAANSMRSTRTRFSNKAKSIVTAVVTPEFKENFKTELLYFGAPLTVDISPVVRDSETSHSFAISSQKPCAVLSEGEQKVVSLCAFLAEIKTFSNHHPIILDDPVSSLDHIYREKIAARLCQEAMTRQVIIFTHDLALIMEIDSKCEVLLSDHSTCPPLSSFTIRRNGRDSGICYQEAPWRGMTTGGRASYLEKSIHSFKELYDSDISKYNEKTAMLYSLLREAWESAIEQDLFYSIVSRGRNSIQTLNKIESITIEASDTAIISANMTLTSTWMQGHDKSKAFDENRPSPSEVLGHIAALKSFSKTIVDRRKSTGKAKATMPVCEIG